MDKKIELLYKSIEDNQNTIRFVDTKAAAVLLLIGILFTYLTTIYRKIKELIFYFYKNDNMNIIGECIHVLLIISFFIIITFLFLSLYLAFLTLIAKNNPEKSINIDVKKNKMNIFYLSNIIPKINIINIFNNKNGFFRLKESTSFIMDVVKKSEEEDIVQYLTFEILKLSYIREMKINRINFSLLLLKLCFIIIFIFSLFVLIKDFWL